MKTLHLAPALLSLVSLPGLAFANDFSGAFSLSHGAMQSEGVDATTLRLNGGVKAVMDNGLSLRARLDSTEGREDGADGVSASLVGGAIGYRLGQSLGTGFYVERAELNVDGFGDLGTLTSYGVTLGLTTPGMNLDGFYGISTTSPDVDGLTITDFGLFSSYEAQENLILAGNVVNTRLSGAGEAANLTVIGGAAAFALTDQVTAFGALTESSLDDVDVSLTTLGLGVSYDTTDMARFGSVVSLELVQMRGEIDGDTADADTLRLGLTVPFGATTSRVPVGTVAGSVLHPTHNAVSALVLGAF